MQSVTDYSRFCPDQPKVLISDAICIGRRRNRYPACPGCQFNDDERSAGKANGDGMPVPEDIEKVFVGGRILGSCPGELNEKVAWRIGHAAASFLRGALHGLDRSDPVARTVVIGIDKRSSSAKLSASFIAGARSTGSHVVDIGCVDTPQLSYAINHLRCCGGAQTTGGSFSPEQNGFLIFGQGGRPIGADTGLHDIFRIAQNMIRHATGQEGSLRTLSLENEYRAFIRSHLATPRELRIAVDDSGGVAGKWVATVFQDVPGVEFVFVESKASLSSAEGLSRLAEAVKTERAGLGVRFDADADELSVVDEKGGIVSSDMVTALLARYFLKQHPGSTIVYDLRCSRMVSEEIKAAGGVPRRERAGHDFLSKALSESKGIFGGQLEGRFYFQDNHYCDSTLLALAYLINLLTRERVALSMLCEPLKRYCGSGPLQIAHSDGEAALRAMAKAYSGARVDFLDGLTVQEKDWWFHLRHDTLRGALELIVESNSEETLHERVEEVRARIDACR